MTPRLSRRAALAMAVLPTLPLPVAAETAPPLRVVTSFAVDSMTPWEDGLNRPGYPRG
ncbi:MAG: hypothetical protein ACK414_01620 [Gemmobacter sp.]